LDQRTDWPEHAWSTGSTSGLSLPSQLRLRPLQWGIIAPPFSARVQAEDHGEVGPVLIGDGVIADRAVEGMRDPDPRIAEISEDDLAGATGRDQLVEQNVGARPAEREVLAPLPDQLVTRREGNAMAEAATNTTSPSPSRTCSATAAGNVWSFEAMAPYLPSNAAIARRAQRPSSLRALPERIAVCCFLVSQSRASTEATGCSYPMSKQ